MNWVLVLMMCGGNGCVPAYAEIYPQSSICEKAAKEQINQSKTVYCIPVIKRD